MQNDTLERAKQFLPFDALNGFRDFLSLSEKNIEDKTELSDDLTNIINKKIAILKKGMKVQIKYYYGSEYIETTGVVKRIDCTYKNIYLSNSKIGFSDILDIDVL